MEKVHKYKYLEIKSHHQMVTRTQLIDFEHETSLHAISAISPSGCGFLELLQVNGLRVKEEIKRYVEYRIQCHLEEQMFKRSIFTLLT